MSNTLRATLLIAGFSIASKILGAVRQAVLAHNFGAGGEMDIYVASFRVPDLLFNFLVIGTLSVAFIPVFVSRLKTDHKGAMVMATTIFNLTVLTMGALAAVGVVFAGPLTRLIVPGFSGEAQNATALLTRIMMLSPLLFSMSTVLTSVLHSHRRFLSAAIAPLFYNASIIIGVVYFYPKLGLTGLAWGVVLGAGLHFLIQLPMAFKLGFRPFKNLALYDPDLKKIGKLFIPRIFGIDLGQVSLLISSVIGSSLAGGSLAIFYFADDLRSVPLGIFAVPFAVASFPLLAEFFAKNDIQGLKDFLAKTIVQILFLIIPISILVLLLRAQVVRLVLGAGEGTEFDFAATSRTARALGFFMLSLFSQSLIPILAKTFYSMQNTVVPVLAAIASAALNILLALIFVRTLGAEGMALAFSAASIFNMLILLALLRRRIGDIRDRFLAVRSIKITIASVVMAIFTFLTLYGVAPIVDTRTYIGILIQAAAASVVAAASYLFIGKMIGLSEADGVLRIGKAWFTKFTKPLASMIVSVFTDLR